MTWFSSRNKIQGKTNAENRAGNREDRAGKQFLVVTDREFERNN